MTDASPSAQATPENSMERPQPTHLLNLPQTLFWSFIALVSALGVFVLPFAFPPRIPTLSSSYTYGFGNRIAMLAMVGISAAVLIVLWSSNLGRSPATPPATSSVHATMPRRWLFLAALTAILFTAVLGGRVIYANILYDDAGYMMIQLGRALHDHAVLYRDIEWPYGPLLFLWPAYTQRLLAHIGIGPSAAYMVSLAIAQIAGLGLLFYILHWLPLSRRMRLTAFALFTFGTLTPVLGLNYTLSRFLLPHAVFLAITRCRSLAAQALLFAVGELFVLGVSPELGIAFLGGVGGYGLYRAFTVKPAWIIAAATPILGFAAFYALMIKEYFAVMATFAIGGFNMLVQPQFYIFVLLIAAIALSPIALAPYLRTRDPRAAAMLGFYIISLGMLGPAFGRCDPLHTFFGGLGVYLLSLLAVDQLPGIPAKAWVLALCAAVFLHQYDKTYRFLPMIERVLTHGPTDQDGVDLTRLETLTHGQRIATPVACPLRVNQELVRLGQLQPGYFVYTRGDWDDEAEQHMIADMRQAPFALIPQGKFTLEYEDPDPRRRVRMLRFGYNYRKRFTPWIMGVLITRELQNHWTAVGSVGEYIVYRQNGV